MGLPIMFTIKCGVVNQIWRCSPISLKHMSLWCLLAMSLRHKLCINFSLSRICRPNFQTTLCTHLDMNIISLFLLTLDEKHMDGGWIASHYHLTPWQVREATFLMAFEPISSDGTKSFLRTLSNLLSNSEPCHMHITFPSPMCTIDLDMVRTSSLNLHTCLK